MCSSTPPLLKCTQRFCRVDQMLVPVDSALLFCPSHVVALLFLIKPFVFTSYMGHFWLLWDLYFPNHNSLAPSKHSPISWGSSCFLVGRCLPSFLSHRYYRVRSRRADFGRKSPVLRIPLAAPPPPNECAPSVSASEGPTVEHQTLEGKEFPFIPSRFLAWIPHPR